MDSKRRKELFSVLFVLILVGITIGYAVLSTNFNITGSSQVKNNTWDIHFNNVQITSGSVLTPSPDQPATITQNNTTEVTYIVTLSRPGDFYEFTVDAKNFGTIDGMVSEITSKYNGTTIDQDHPLPVYLDYSVAYEDGVQIANNHLLKAGESETYRVRLEFKSDIENNQLPSTDQSNSFSFEVTYIQADNNATPKPINYVYSTSNTLFYLGQAVPGGVTTYNNYQDAITASGRYSFIRHRINNGLIAESYVGLVNNNVYYLKGGDGGSAFNENRTVLKTAFGEDNCTSINSTFTFYHCSVHGNPGMMYGYANSIGAVTVTLDNIDCYINSDGSSYCDIWD